MRDKLAYIHILSDGEPLELTEAGYTLAEVRAHLAEAEERLMAWRGYYASAKADGHDTSRSYSALLNAGRYRAACLRAITALGG